MIKGVDVSESNGYIDWDALTNEGVRFVYVRCSYGKTGVDSMFRANVDAAHARGMLVGAYHYGYGLTPSDAVLEAQNCRSVIDSAGVLLELPVFYDMEDADGYKMRHGFVFSGANATAICKAFMDNLGLNTGVYASYGWLEECVASKGGETDGCPIDWHSLGCPVWNAQWGNSDDLGGYVWQYTDTNNTLDRDYMYDESLFN